MGQASKAQKRRAENIARVVEYHARGMTFQQIANLNIEGIGDKQQAHRLWKAGLEALPKIAAEEYRQVENVKLDNIERKLNGIITGAENDTKDVIRAAQTLINAMKRRADLNGLDLAATDAPGGGVQTVFVDTSVLLKTRRAPGEGDGDTSG